MNKLDLAWEENFNEFVAFCNKNLCLPTSTSNPKLYNWYNYQCKQRTLAKLPKYRENKLNHFYKMWHSPLTLQKFFVLQRFNTVKSGLTPLIVYIKDTNKLYSYALENILTYEDLYTKEYSKYINEKYSVRDDFILRKNSPMFDAFDKIFKINFGLFYLVSKLTLNYRFLDMRFLKSNLSNSVVSSISEEILDMIKSRLSSPEERYVIEEKYFLRSTVAEVARDLEVSSKTVRSLEYKALKSLREGFSSCGVTSSLVRKSLL